MPKAEMTSTIQKPILKYSKVQKRNIDQKDELAKKKDKRNKAKKLKQLMRKRLIIRNLSFQVSEDQLKTIFAKHGEVLDVKIPLKKDGKKRGFAFVQYKDTKSLVQAMKALNFKKIHGRPVAIDFAVDKVTYQTRMQNANSKPSVKDSKSDDVSDSESCSEKEEAENEEESLDFPDESKDKSDDENKVKSFLKEFDADADDDPADQSSDETSEDEESDDHEEEASPGEEESRKKNQKRKQTEDVSEGKTIFIRNLSFKNTEEDLQEVMQEYGDIVYCLLCTDPVTGFPKGTAFVKFKEKESADKLIEESSKEPGILLDGRKLLCTQAVSRGEVSKLSCQDTKVKDRRNLRLLKSGVIMLGSKEAEGVSPADMTKRSQLEMMKKQKLKNVNFFVSDVRLAVHNLPKDLSDKALRAIFRKAACKEAVITEARVMKDFTKTDAQGRPVSRGFGFVSFTRHEDALQALNKINNNPTIFTAHKRPIVEFSVENKVALLAQKRKKENQLKRKKKMEENLSEENQAEQKFEKQAVQKINFGEKSFKKRKNDESFSPKKKPKTIVNEKQRNEEKQIPKSKKKKSKHLKKSRKNFSNKQDHQSIAEIANKYKKKLFNQL